MTNEIIIAIISAVAGGIVTLLTTLALDKRKETRLASINFIDVKKDSDEHE